MIVTVEAFTENLKKILREDCSGYPIRSFDVDMRVQEAPVCGALGDES